MTAALKNMRDFCETTSSKRIYASEYVNAGVPFYRSKEVIERQSGKLDVSTEIFITESRFEEIERKFGSPQKGDLLLTSVGTLGIPYVVGEGERFYFKDGNLTWFRNFHGLDSRYLYYWLLSPLGKSELKKATIGSSQSAYTINLLSNLVISPPDIDEQHRVVELLSGYDDLIETNRLRIALLEESARLLYREWFVKLRFPNHESVKVVDGVPEGWQKGQLLDLCCEIRDQIDPASLPQGTPYLSMEHMPQKSICLGEWETSQKVNSAKLRFDKLDILFGKIRPYFHKVGIAQTTGITSTDVIVARAKRELFLPLLALTMSSDEFVAHSVVTSNGTKMPRANWKLLQHWPMLIPEDAVLCRFSEFTMPMISTLTDLSEQNRLLAQARDALLPKLMSGQLAV